MADIPISLPCGFIRFLGKYPQRWIGPAPANDECASAITLSGALPLSDAGSNYHATWTDDDWYYNSVWYTWTAPSTDPVIIEVSSALDLYLTVYSGSCGALVFVDVDSTLVALTPTASTTYYFKVETFDENDGGDFTITVRAPEGVEAPVLSMDPPAYSRNLILSWTAPIGATYFYLERCEGEGCSGFTEIFSSALFSYTDRALTAATTYRYRVRCTNGEEYSAYSSVVEGTTLAGEVGVERFGGAAGIVSDLSRCGANDHPPTLGFGDMFVSEWIAPVGVTSAYPDTPPYDTFPPATYRLRLDYYATSSYTSTDLTERIVDTTGGGLYNQPSAVHTLECRFVTGSRDVLTRTAEADGWIEARLDGTVILRVDDIKVLPSTSSYPWNTAVICGAGHFTSWYVQQDATYYEGFATPDWRAKRPSDANTLWSDRVRDTTRSALFADLGGFWTRSDIPNAYPLDVTVEGYPALWSNIDALKHTWTDIAPLGDQEEPVAIGVPPGSLVWSGAPPSASFFWEPTTTNAPYRQRTIRRLRQAPHLSDEQQWLHYSRLQLDLETGQGLTTGQGQDPQLMLQWSDDGGRTWSREHWVSAGRLGAYKWRALWRRLGRSRNRIFRIVQSDPTKVAWIDAFMDVDRGTH